MRMTVLLLGGALAALPAAPSLLNGHFSLTPDAYAQGRGGGGNDRDDGDRGRGNDRGGGNEVRGADVRPEMRGPGGPPMDAPGRARFEEAQDRVQLAAQRRGRDLDNNDVDALVAGGWGNRALNDGFRNNGERVHTYVAIAKALGQPAYVGALQANFGADKPGEGPAGDWRTINLDVNGDKVIDAKDLAAAQARTPPPPAQPPAAPRGM